MNRYNIRVAAVALVFILFSCSKDEDVFVPKVLVDSQLSLTRSASELQTFLGVSGLNVPINELEFDVDLYHVTYKTKYKDQEVEASGLVFLPTTTEPVGMISFQHGTIAKHSEAPSELPLSSGQLILYSGLASPGFITVLPDYIGFGSSSSILHPYYIEEATANAVIDLLKAARELAILKKLNFNKKLFLAGYSQGGYATMAAHKAIETSGLDNFDLVASFPASGGYDIKEVQNFFFNQEIYEQPFFMAFVAVAYKAHYNWTQPLTDLFQQPYASAMPALFDGSKDGGQINASLTTTVSELVAPDIHANIDTDSKYTYILTAFEENSLTDWTPETKMFMYHGDADVWVPYYSSITTYNKLIANGASTSTVTLTTLPGKTHSTGVVPYIEDIIPKILQMR
jgi:pimeloyl-ACP methyl ester carboxylesterase